MVLIGASGHSFLYVPDNRYTDLDFAAVAPGSQGEAIENMIQKLHDRGLHPAVYADYREMLKKEKPDLVIVDNYYGEHAPVILDAFAAGCHVLAEKPVAADRKQLEQIHEAWKKAGTSFTSMFTYRYEGAFYRAWQMIQEGAVGKVRLLNAQKSYKMGIRPEFMTRRETYGGTIPWVGIHGIDWILWMSGGSVESVSAVQSSSEAVNGKCPETTALVQFRMSDGIMGSLTVDYLNPKAAPNHGDDRIRVVGTGGVLEVRNNEIHLINENGVQLYSGFEAEEMLSDFLDQIAGKKSCRIPAEDVFAATKAALMAQEAADSGMIVYA